MNLEIEIGHRAASSALPAAAIAPEDADHRGNVARHRPWTDQGERTDRQRHAAINEDWPAPAGVQRKCR